MSISDGQPVNAAATNAAFMSRTVDTSTIGKVSLQESGSGSIGDIQKLTNAIMSDIGRATEVDATSKDYSSNNVVANGDDRKVAIGKLDAEFDSTTGHNHDGSAGNGKPISAANLTNVNNFYSAFQSVNFDAASGTSVDVSSAFTGKTPGGLSNQVGVVTTGANNIVHIVDKNLLTFIEDVEGQRVYGRLTESAGVWTLSFYTNEAGVETAHTLALIDLKLIYWEVFTQETRPTFPSNPFEFGTLDVTADVVDASLTERGVLNPTALLQEMAGNKYWTGTSGFADIVDFDGDVHFASSIDSVSSGTGVVLPALSKLVTFLENSGLISVAGITRDGSGYQETRILINNTVNDITIIHNDGTAGVSGFYCPNGIDFTWKSRTGILITYTSNLSDRWTITGGGGGSLFSLNAVGSTPNADGASYNSLTGAFNLQPADATNPGVLVNADQILPGGDKIFSNSFGGAASSFSFAGSDLQLPSSLPTLYILDNPATVSIARIALPNLSNYAIFKVITNKSGASITIKNNTGSPVNERIITGTGADIILGADASLFIVREPGSARWHVVGGSGSGSSFTQPVSTQSISNDGNFSISLTEKFQLLKGVGAVANSIVNLRPEAFGFTGPIGGTVIKILGTSDTAQFRMLYSNTSFGTIINGDAVFGNGSMMELIYDSSTQRWHECSRNF